MVLTIALMINGCSLSRPLSAILCAIWAFYHIIWCRSKRLWFRICAAVYVPQYNVLPSEFYSIMEKICLHCSGGNCITLIRKSATLPCCHSARRRFKLLGGSVCYNSFHFFIRATKVAGGNKFRYFK